MTDPQTEGEHDTHYTRPCRRTAEQPPRPEPEPGEVEPDWLERVREAGL